MVKNTTGGKGSKNLARKNESFTSSGKLRLPEDTEFELFAVVTKALGNCMFHVNTSLGHQNLLLHVRGKFSGKNKRNNFISVGTFILVGLRDFQKPNFKDCDLLDIYNDNDVKRLSFIPSIQSSFFSSTSTSTSTSDFIFSNSTDNIIQDTIISNKVNIDNDNDNDNDIDIIIDDI